MIPGMRSLSLQREGTLGACDGLAGCPRPADYGVWGRGTVAKLDVQRELVIHKASSGNAGRWAYSLRGLVQYRRYFATPLPCTGEQVHQSTLLWDFHRW